MTELIYLLVMTHITIICVTLYLHRGQAHRGISFHPVVSHFMRFWLWLTTGMITKQWVAVHRMHHKDSDKEGDPHSPQIYGIWRVIFGGAFLYRKYSSDPSVNNVFGIGTPDDYMERMVYTPLNWLGVILLLILNFDLFGVNGIIIWAIQMVWIPFWAAGIVNGVGHKWGYRNGDTRDNSRNFFPLGIIIAGEELHNNHHLDPGSVNLRRRWFEIDLGFLYLKFLCWLRLAKINRLSTVQSNA